jgi:hypothetical protein
VTDEGACDISAAANQGVAVDMDDIGRHVYVIRQSSRQGFSSPPLPLPYHRDMSGRAGLARSQLAKASHAAPDPMTTMAAIDRVVHHSVILDLMGTDSYCAREVSKSPRASARSVSERSRCMTASPQSPVIYREKGLPPNLPFPKRETTYYGCSADRRPSSHPN